MKTKTSPVFSQKNENLQSYNIIGDLNITIEVTNNPFGIPLDSLFNMAARMNKKRSFLFVSKVLGKHIPVKPHVSLLAGAALGLLYQQFRDEPLPLRMEQLLKAFEAPEAASEIFDYLKQNKMLIKDKTLFIGFAETATALGHSMFDFFEGNASFLHTTRESIGYMSSCIDFEEEHSHATTHRCYANDPSIFQDAETIILIDDEMTTGKTTLNIISDLHARYGKKNYVVASLLDWRSNADIEQFHSKENELGVSIQCLSLVAGQITLTGSPIETTNHEDKMEKPAVQPNISSIRLDPYFAHLPAKDVGVAYVAHTGRFGITAEENNVLNDEVNQAAAFLSSYRTGGKLLCMGTGEFMFIPMLIAAKLAGDVSYQSSTRSPIHPDANPEYAVRSAYKYESPEHADVMNFMYNIPPGHYDQMFLFMEREVASDQLEQLQQALVSLEIKDIRIVYCSSI